MTVTREIALDAALGQKRRRPRPGPALWGGAGIIVLILICAGWMSFWPPHDPLTAAGDPLSGPNGSTLLGTDNLGRDTFTRLALAARTSLLISGSGALLGAVIGTFFGLISGYVGGWADAVIMRVVDAMLALPALLVALVVGVIIGTGPLPLIVSLGLVFAPGFARVMRAPVIAMRERDFVMAARLSGIRGSRIVVEHLLPNVLTPLFVQFASVASQTTDMVDTSTAVLAARAEERRARRGLSARSAFLLRRLGRLVISLAVVVLASFFLMHLVPGDPVRAALGQSATPELVASTRAQLGLDKPLLQQFFTFVSGLFTGDIGTSVRLQRPVFDVIGQRFPTTLLLAVLAFVIAIVGALPAGVGAAVFARSSRNRGLTIGLSAVLGILIAVPSFLLAVGLIALFAVQLGWLPAAGWGSADEAVLPVIALAVGPMAYLVRIVQVEMLTVLDTTYMTTARSKRLPRHLIYLRHALPNIVTASLTVGGLILAGLTAATVLIERVFAIPGLGDIMVSSVGAKDYPMVQGVVIVYALIVLGVNLVVDVILATIDPRSSITEG